VSDDEPRPPYVTALMAVRDLGEIPPDVLRHLRAGVLRIVNDDEPGLMRAAAHLRARVLLADMLEDLAQSYERITPES